MRQLGAQTLRSGLHLKCNGSYALANDKMKRYATQRANFEEEKRPPVAFFSSKGRLQGPGVDLWDRLSSCISASMPYPSVNDIGSFKPTNMARHRLWARPLI